MENSSNPATITAHIYSIGATRMRKDIFKKPTPTALIHVHWDGDSTEHILKLTLDLTIREKNEARPIELAFVSIEVACSYSGGEKSDGTTELPTAVMVRIGQRAADMAFGVVLAKSASIAAFQDLEYPEVPLQVFLPPPFPNYMLN
jgi:hypothetical protein